MIFLRFLVGVGLGMELVTIDTYLTEWVPAHLRTRAFAFAFFVQFLSVPAVALMSWWLVPQTIWGLSGWRYVVIAGALASLVIWLVRKAAGVAALAGAAAVLCAGPAGDAGYGAALRRGGHGLPVAPG